MPTPFALRPAADEYAPYYAGYISRVPDVDIRRTLEEQHARTRALLDGVPESRGEHRYAAGKWSLKEMLGHVADTERIMAYRALRIGRGDTTPLPGFEQDDYVRTGGFDRRTIADLLEELAIVRQATLALFRHLDAEALARAGTASGFPVTCRALGWIIAGHELHHQEQLSSRYL